MTSSVSVGYDEQIQAVFIERASLRCAAAGHVRVAIFGAGQHTRRHGLRPFASSGLEIVAVLDDHATGEIDGVPIRSPNSFNEPCDAVIVSSDAREDELFTIASSWAKSRGVEVLRVYDLPTTPSCAMRAQDREHELARLAETFTGKLNLGCGEEPLSGWTNIDGGDGQWYAAPKSDGIVRLDVFDALDHIDDNSCDAVFSEHFFEHFSLDDGHRLIAEWARVLRPGGVVRIVTPNLERESRLYLREISPASDEVIEAHRRRWLGERYELKPGEHLTRAMVLNFGMRLDGHRFIYDFATISQSLELAGFGRVEQTRFGESWHGVFMGIDRHDGGDTGRSWVPEMVLAVDAVRNPS